jgi:translation initiation factor IF-2
MAHLTFATKEAAAAAVTLTGLLLQGRPITVTASEPLEEAGADIPVAGGGEEPESLITLADYGGGADAAVEVAVASPLSLDPFANFPRHDDESSDGALPPPYGSAGATGAAGKPKPPPRPAAPPARPPPPRTMSTSAAAAVPSAAAPAPRGSIVGDAGISGPYNVVHQTHASVAQGAVAVSRPSRPMPPSAPTPTSAGSNYGGLFSNLGAMYTAPAPAPAAPAAATGDLLDVDLLS